MTAEFPAWLTYTASGGIGAAVAWLSLRLNGALVWRTNAEGYQAELERVQHEHELTIARFEQRIADLDKRLTDAQDTIRALQSKTDITPVAATARDVLDLLEQRTPMFATIRENTERIEALERSRLQGNEKIIAELEGHVFPAIEAIHRAVVLQGGEPGPTGPAGPRGPRGRPAA